jgi:hypothetical protein
VESELRIGLSTARFRVIGSYKARYSSPPSAAKDADHYAEPTDRQPGEAVHQE